MEVSTSLKSSYDNQYNSADTEWRRKSAERKARNVTELAAAIKPSKVLEVGCGEGSILYWLDQWGFCPELYAVDISESGIRQTREKNMKSLAEARVFDGYTLPYPDNYFDLAYCAHVIEHVEFPRKLMREIMRVSKFQHYEVPIDFSFYVDRKAEHFFAYGHLNIYTPSLFRYLLISEGHKVIKEICGQHNKGIVKLLFKDNPKGLAIFNVKALILRCVPWLRGIKPDFYAVLTDKSGETAERAFARALE